MPQTTVEWWMAENQRLLEYIAELEEKAVKATARMAELEAIAERSTKSLVLSDKAMRECQLLLCPQERWGTCADQLQDGEKCACGFEDGPFANAVPKNRAAELLQARVDLLLEALAKANARVGELEAQLAVAHKLHGYARVAELEDQLKKNNHHLAKLVNGTDEDDPQTHKDAMAQVIETRAVLAKGREG